MADEIYAWRDPAFPVDAEGRPLRIPRDSWEQLEPTEILIESLGRQDDDLRIRIGEITVSDTQWNVGWYKGEDFVTSSLPPFPDTTLPEAWRVIRLTRADWRDVGACARPGELVYVDVFDGWGNGWEANPWRASITWPNGRTIQTIGGQARTGTSPIVNPPTSPFSTGPHGALYIPNGFVHIPCPCT